MQIANLLVDLSITTAAIYDMLLQLSVSKTEISWNDDSLYFSILVLKGTWNAEQHT